MGTEQLAGQKVCMIADTLTILHILTSFSEYGVCLFPKFFGYDSRYDLSGFVLKHDPFLRREEFLFLGEHIHYFDLVAYIVAFVLGIGDHIGHGGMGNLLAIVVAVAFLPKQDFKLLHGVFIGSVQLKQFTHHHSLFFINHQAAIIFDISKDAAVTQHYILLNGLLMSEFHTRGQLTELILRNGGHDGQTKF